MHVFLVSNILEIILQSYPCVQVTCEKDNFNINNFIKKCCHSQVVIFYIFTFCTVFHFLHLTSLLCTVFRKNYTALSQSELRNFFMYIIKRNIACI